MRHVADEPRHAKAFGTGTDTGKETVNTAPREVPENRRSAPALTRLRAAAEDGAFGPDLFEGEGNHHR